jgi:ferric-chelate reductase
MAWSSGFPLFNRSATFAAKTPNAVHPGVDSMDLVFHITILILAIFGFFALLTLPRLIVRFTRASEWPRGHFLYTTTLNDSHKAWKRKYNISSPLETTGRGAPRYPASDDSHTLYSHTHLIRHNDEKGLVLSLPPHLISWSGRYHRISTFLGKQCFPGYSIGRSILVLGYTSIVFYATVYKSNPLIDLQRSGLVAMAQVPIIFALGSKNNVLGMMWAAGYEKVSNETVIPVFRHSDTPLRLIGCTELSVSYSF